MENFLPRFAAKTFTLLIVFPGRLNIGVKIQITLEVLPRFALIRSKAVKEFQRNVAESGNPSNCSRIFGPIHPIIPHAGRGQTRLKLRHLSSMRKCEFSAGNASGHFCTAGLTKPYYVQSYLMFTSHGPIMVDAL